MFNGQGKLIYDPYARIKFEPWWLILKTDEELIRYYQSYIKKIYDVKFEKTTWGSHISVNRGVEPPNKKDWNKYKGEIIPFTYSHKVERVHWFFYVDAYSKRLEDIRKELGLSKLPPCGFHITIGRVNKIYNESQLKNYALKYSKLAV